MAELYCIDLFTDRPLYWMKHYPFREASNAYGGYYTATVGAKDKSEIILRARKSHIRYRCCETRWARADHCREKFLRAVPGPYRCQYCGRKISRSQMVVDHIVPVAKAKSAGIGRQLLLLRGITDVNDVRNLTASCRACNRRKSDKLGLWYLQGVFGHPAAFRALRGAVIMALILLAAYSIQIM